MNASIVPIIVSILAVSAQAAPNAVERTASVDLITLDNFNQIQGTYITHTS